MLSVSASVAAAGHTCVAHLGSTRCLGQQQASGPRLRGLQPATLAHIWIASTAARLSPICRPLQASTAPDALPSQPSHRRCSVPEGRKVSPVPRGRSPSLSSLPGVSQRAEPGLRITRYPPGDPLTSAALQRKRRHMIDAHLRLLTRRPGNLS